MRLQSTLVLIVSALGAVCSAEAPKLTIVSATSSEVKLTWSGGQTKEFVIERKALNGAYSDLKVVEDRQASDTGFSPYETYLYRVREKETEEQVKNKQRNPSSNEWKVGPPPVGLFSLYEADAAHAGVVGFSLAMVPDANGDPMLAWANLDANLDSDLADSTLHFRNWDRLNYKWNPIQQIDVVGSIESDAGNRELSLALDRKTGTIGIGYIKAPDANNREIWLATSSDGGKTFTKKQWHPRGQYHERPSLGMDGGTVYMLFLTAGGPRYSASKLTETPKWGPLPTLPKAKLSEADGPVLAMDGTGQPGIAYWQISDEEGSTLPWIVTFWRPGGAPVQVARGGGDNPALDLTFGGTKPSIAMLMQTNPEDFDEILHVSTSADGKAWTPLARVPRDGRDGWFAPVSIASSGQGSHVIAISCNVGYGDAKHGRPKVARSADAKAWTTSSTDPGKALDMRVVYDPRVMLLGNGKTYVAYRFAEDGHGKHKPGVYLWREQ